MSIPEACIDPVEAREVAQLTTRMRPYENRLSAAFDLLEKVRIAELPFTDADARTPHDHLPHHYDHSGIDPFWSFCFTLYGERQYQVFVVPKYAEPGDSGLRVATIEHSIDFDDFFDRFDAWKDEKERIIQDVTHRYHEAWRRGQV